MRGHAGPGAVEVGPAGRWMETRGTLWAVGWRAEGWSWSILSGLELGWAGLATVTSKTEPHRYPPLLISLHCFSYSDDGVKSASLRRDS